MQELSWKLQVGHAAQTRLLMAGPGISSALCYLPIQPNISRPPSPLTPLPPADGHTSSNTDDADAEAQADSDADPESIADAALGDENASATGRSDATNQRDAAEASTQSTTHEARTSGAAAAAEAATDPAAGPPSTAADEALRPDSSAVVAVADATLRGVVETASQLAAEPDEPSSPSGLQDATGPAPADPVAGPPTAGSASAAASGLQESAADLPDNAQAAVGGEDVTSGTSAGPAVVIPTTSRGPTPRLGTPPGAAADAAAAREGPDPQEPPSAASTNGPEGQIPNDTSVSVPHDQVGNGVMVRHGNGGTVQQDRNGGGMYGSSAHRMGMQPACEWDVKEMGVQMRVDAAALEHLAAHQGVLRLVGDLAQSSWWKTYK